jgi:hypothetical protein
MSLLLLLAACSEAPAPADTPAQDSGEDSADTDTGTDTDPVDTGVTLDLGTVCEPGVSDCGPDALCCTACCKDAEEPICTLADEFGGCPLPDLSVDEGRLTNSLESEWIDVAPDDCEIEEGCVDAPGMRRVLRFATTTPNSGTADLSMGKPENNPDTFVYSECHDHYHFTGYANYRLLTPEGQEAATGHKQAFCLMDYENWDQGGRARYNCNVQGISVGWADTYDSYLPCQWIDITGVPSGDYTLEVSLNPDHFIPELSYDNNILQVPVTIDDSSEPGADTGVVDTGTSTN